MTYRVKRVDRLPSVVDENVVYVCDEYEIAALKCACGCGHTVTLLLDDGHQVRDVEGFADISPSIGVWDAACKSHFWIRQGNVIWGRTFSEHEIRAAMGEQLSRHLELTQLSRPWYKRLANWITRGFRRQN